MAVLLADKIPLLYDTVATHLVALLLADKISLLYDTVAKHLMAELLADKHLCCMTCLLHT